MKLNQNKSSTQPQISEIVDYYMALEEQSPPGKAVFHDSAPQISDPEMYVLYLDSGLWAKKPNPPTPEAVAKAQFVDKTYVWHGK